MRSTFHPRFHVVSTISAQGILLANPVLTDPIQLPDDHPDLEPRSVLICCHQRNLVDAQIAAIAWAPVVAERVHVHFPALDLPIITGHPYLDESYADDPSVPILQDLFSLPFEDIYDYDHCAEGWRPDFAVIAFVAIALAHEPNVMVDEPLPQDCLKLAQQVCRTRSCDITGPNASTRRKE